MSRNEQNLGLAIPTLMGKGVSVNFTKNYSDRKYMKCPEVHTKYTQNFICTNPQLLIELGGINLQKLFCEGLHKMSRDIQKSHVCQPFIPLGYSLFTTSFFPRNYMKYPDWHRKVIVTKLTSLMGW